MKLRLILSLLIFTIALGTSSAQNTPVDGGKAKKEKKVKEPKPEKEPKEKKVKEPKPEKEPKEKKVKEPKAEKETKEGKEKKPRPPYYSTKFPSVHVNAGSMTLFGDDIGAEKSRYNAANFRWGFGGGFEHRTFSALGFSLNFLYGQLSRTERNPIANGVRSLNAYEAVNNRNVETDLMMIDLKVNIYLDNNLIINRASPFSPYLFGGIGYILNFSPKSNYTDDKGSLYNYWDSGLIYDVAREEGNLGSANEIQQDGKYETDLDTNFTGGNITQSALAIPFGLGLRYKLSRKFHVDINATYYWTLTDQLDASEKGDQADRFLYTSIGFAYHIGAKTKVPDTTQWDTFDFLSIDNADDDGDGVRNMEDLCSGTIAGPVDENGCPLDSDKDGVPDYRDEESSADSALVDASGITIDPDFIELGDTNALAHAIIYEAYPSMRQQPIGNYYTFDKPEAAETKRDLGDFTQVDRNSDGFISTDEITWAIDAFFEGELDFSAAKLHDLIDFFFDQ